MISPLQLNNYFIRELVVRENAAFSPDGTERNAGKINCSLEYARSIDPPDHYLVVLTVAVDPSSTKPALDPYQITLKIQGVFSFRPDEQLTPERIERMATVNGASILFGLARGLVAQATGVAQFGKYLLPPVNFVEMFEEKQSAPSEAQGKDANRQKVVPQSVH